MVSKVVDRTFAGYLLLKGPGLIQRKMPLDGRAMAMALPNQYDRTRRNRVETANVCGLK